MVSKHENISKNQFRYFGVISGGFFFICTKFTISYVHIIIKHSKQCPTEQRKP